MATAERSHTKPPRRVVDSLEPMHLEDLRKLMDWMPKTFETPRIVHDTCGKANFVDITLPGEQPTYYTLYGVLLFSESPLDPTTVIMSRAMPHEKQAQERFNVRINTPEDALFYLAASGVQRMAYLEGESEAGMGYEPARRAIVDQWLLQNQHNILTMADIAPPERDAFQHLPDEQKPGELRALVRKEYRKLIGIKEQDKEIL